MQVSMDEAYREACLALGEAVVRERLLVQQAATLATERDALAVRLAERDADAAEQPSASGL